MRKPYAIKTALAVRKMYKIQLEDKFLKYISIFFFMFFFLLLIQLNLFYKKFKIKYLFIFN